MFTHYRAHGLILSSRKRGEADEVFTLYTREFGMIDVSGRSIRKSSSKLKMGMSLFSLVEIGFIQGKSYNTLTDVIPLYRFKSAHLDLGKLSLFYRISEIVRSLVYGEEGDEELFSFLLEIFKKIDKSSLKKDELKLFYCFFAFNLLYFLGYKVYIEKCVFCGQEVEKSCYFNSKEGGVVCEGCFVKKPSGAYLEDIEFLRCFFEENMDKVFSQDADFINSILEDYLTFIPEKNILYKK